MGAVNHLQSWRPPWVKMRAVNCLQSWRQPWVRTWPPAYPGKLLELEVSRAPNGTEIFDEVIY